MTTFLITALIVTTLICLMLGWACYRLWTTMEQGQKYNNIRLKEWPDEREEKDRYLSGILRVLNANTGGISKRISESAEIAEAIYSFSPDLFRQCKGLAYWLHANDQFLTSLYAIAAEGIDRDHRQRVHEMKKTGRAEVFGRIYESAGLSVPSVLA